MQIKLFTISISDNGTSAEEMNRFLRSNKILEVESHLVSNENGSSWCFCVKYIEKQTSNEIGKTFKTDYKQELSEPIFLVFSKLREIRKILATEDAVPAYAVFTDKELVEIAKLEELNEKTMQTVRGVGENKMGRYGKRLIELMTNTLNDETGRKLI